MSGPEERVAHRMKEARRRAGISQEEAGRRLRVTLRTYARWERGETFGFIGHIGEIAKALDTTPDELLAGEQLTAPTVEELSTKLDTVLTELAEIREELKPPRPSRAARR